MSAPTAVVGGIPNIPVDIPVSAVLVALFITLAASHMTLFQKNRRRGHKFVFNALLFGFCMSRIVALVMRIAWATRPSDSNIAIAAQIFINAGILLVYVLNNLLVQRLLRASMPKLGWNRWFRIGYKVFLFLVVPVLIMVIVTVVQSFKTTDADTRRIDRDIQLASLTYITIVAAAPLAVLPVAVFAREKQHVDHFGEGSWYAKAALLAATSILACIEAGFRCGTSWDPARLATDPAWYDSKAAFYCFNFMIDIILATLFLVGRFDRRFHVPDGSDGSYAARREELAAQQNEKAATDSETTEAEQQQRAVATDSERL